jgi:aldehyde:ferredoxin oxidoreductase
VDNILDSLGAVGIVKTREELQDLGKRIFEEKYKFKVQEGFDLSRALVPRRFYETISAQGMVTPETVEEMLRIYRKKRGWS